MNIAVAQWQSTPGQPEANRAKARSVIAEAAAENAELIVLPELFTVGYFAFDAWEDAAEPFHGPTLSMASEMAEEHDIAVVAGSFVEDLAATEAVDTPANRGIANTTVLVDRDGVIVTHYRKIHLFGYQSEEATRMVPGDRLGIGDLDGYTFGLSTCYDLRFPELFRAYVDAGVTHLAIPSAWPTPRAAHWSLLCRVRALENQVFLAASNGVGEIDGTELCGRSCLIDPWGEPVVELDDKPGMGIGTAPLDAVGQIREEFPVLEDRRADLSRQS